LSDLRVSGSTRAAVYGMKMTIGKRVIVAKINKREDPPRV
jgi:Ca-activated chloride channel family protein